MIAVFHLSPVLYIRTGLSSEAGGTFEKNHTPAAKCQLAGNDHAGETAADYDGRRNCHFGCPFTRASRKDTLYECLPRVEPLPGIFVGTGFRPLSRLIFPL